MKLLFPLRNKTRFDRFYRRARLRSFTSAHPLFDPSRPSLRIHWGSVSTLPDCHAVLVVDRHTCMYTHRCAYISISYLPEQIWGSVVRPSVLPGRRKQIKPKKVRKPKNGLRICHNYGHVAVGYLRKTPVFTTSGDPVLIAHSRSPAILYSNRVLRAIGSCARTYLLGLCLSTSDCQGCSARRVAYCCTLATYS